MADNNSKYIQLETENFLQYAERLVKGRKNGEYDLDKIEIYELLTNEVVSSSHARKMLCFLEKILEKVETQNINMSEDELLVKLRTEKQELYKAKQQVRDEKNELNNYLREQSRVELFYDRIDESIDKLLKRKSRDIPTLTKTIRECNIVDNKTTDLIVSFADCHYDAEFIVEGFNGEILNEYNRDIFEKRMWKLRDEIVDFAKLHCISKLHIADLGDIMEGIIRVGSLQSVKNSPMDSVLDYTDFIEDWLNNLTNEGFDINFYTSMGNHSELRILNGEIRENLECMYTRLLQKLFKDRTDITIHSNNQGLNYFNVQGYNIFTLHGQREKSILNSIKEYEDTYNIKINYMLIGHKHSKQEIEPSIGKEVIQVRSVMGINEFASIIKKTSHAGATMFTIHKNYGRKYVNDVKFKQG